MRRYLLFGVSVLLTLSSCLTILQQLITPDNIIADNRVEGVWIDSDSKKILVQKLMKVNLKRFAES